MGEPLLFFGHATHRGDVFGFPDADHRAAFEVRLEAFGG